MKKIWLFLIILVVLALPVVKAETLEGEEKKFYHVKFTFMNEDSPIDCLNLTVYKTFTEHLNTFTWASDEYSDSNGIIDIVLEEGRYQFIQSTMVDTFPEFFSWKGDVRQDLEFVVDFSKPVASLQPIIKDEPKDNEQDKEDNQELQNPVDNENNPSDEKQDEASDEKQDEASDETPQDKTNENQNQENINDNLPTDKPNQEDNSNDKEEVNDLATEDEKTNITFDDTLTFNYSWLLLIGALVLGIFKK